MDGSVRLLDGGALQLGAKAGLHVLDILLAQSLLLGFFGLRQAGGLALVCQLVDAIANTLFFIVFFPLSTSYLAVHGFLTAIVSGMFANPLLLSVRKNSPDSSFSRMCQLL